METTVRCLLVEDDIRAQEIVKMLLKKHFTNIQLVATANTLSSARQVIQKEHPQLIIFDINLPDGTAFDLLKEFKSQAFKFIFTTAYDKYAVEAFKFSALNYLLKPYAPTDFIEAIGKALAHIKLEDEAVQLQTFYHNFKNPEDKKILLRDAESIQIVSISQIIEIQSDNNYSRFILENSPEIIESKVLKFFDEKLAPHGFLRVHQSHLVNPAHVLSFNKHTSHLFMSNNIKVPVAQSRKQMLMDYFNSLDKR